MVRVYDNLGQSIDRYTVIFDGGDAIGMSENANQPNGFCQYLGEVSIDDLGVEIELDECPLGVLRQINQALLQGY